MLERDSHLQYHKTSALSFVPKGDSVDLAFIELTRDSMAVRPYEMTTR